MVLEIIGHLPQRIVETLWPKWELFPEGLPYCSGSVRRVSILFRLSLESFSYCSVLVHRGPSITLRLSKEGFPDCSDLGPNVSHTVQAFLIMSHKLSRSGLPIVFRFPILFRFLLVGLPSPEVSHTV
jgi:hypothetical protein